MSSARTRFAGGAAARRRLVGAALAVAVLAPASGAAFGAAAADAPPPDETVMFGTVLADALSPGFVAPSRAPDDLRERIRGFQNRAREFRSSLAVPTAKPGPERSAYEKRTHFERGVVALAPGLEIERLAGFLANRAPLAYEWEGMSEGPLMEAAFAERELEISPATPAAPYLRLFLLHRLRCAFETLTHEGQTAEAEQAAAKYRARLDAARRDPDPLVRFAADDLDRRAYLYLETDRHPSSESGAPGLSIERATALARDYVAAKKIDLSRQHIRSVVLRYDESPPRRGLYWAVQWGWSQPALGGEYGLRVYMDGTIVEAPLGP